MSPFQSLSAPFFLQVISVVISITIPYCTVMKIDAFQDGIAGYCAERCFCDSDDISYTGLHPKLIWERSMTLGRGNDRCDFCMKTIK